MTDALYGLVPVYGAWVLFVTTFVACLILPIPASLVLLAGGAFIASGDLAAGPVAVGALAGAILGDQVGYGVARLGGTQLWGWLLARRQSGPLAERAEDALHARAMSSVFFSRWLVSALGPWINFAAGATRLDWRRFSVASLLGETLWVGIYIGLGFVFASRLDEVGSVVGSVIGALAAGFVAYLLGRALWRSRRAGTA